MPETLSRLHEELAAAPELDAETAALLRDVLTDIEALLARRDASGHESLARKLAEAAADFEASHPRLTAAVGQLADALGRMGI